MKHLHLLNHLKHLNLHLPNHFNNLNVQEDNTTKFPDIIARLPSCLVEGVESAVLDCEAVAWDREKKSIQPFQVGLPPS